MNYVKIIYMFIISESVETNTSRGGICDCCRGDSKTSGGFKWKYKK